MCYVVRYLPTETHGVRPTAESSSHGLVSLSGLTSEHLLRHTLVESIYFNFFPAIRHVRVTSFVRYRISRTPLYRYDAVRCYIQSSISNDALPRLIQGSASFHKVNARKAEKRESQEVRVEAGRM